MAIGSEARSTFLAIVKGDASQAVTEFKKLGTSVDRSTKGAEGSVGKFKQVSSSAFAEVKANAGMMAAGAGVAFAGFALSAANSFADLGTTIGKFRDATGLAAEDASRMVEVAGDLAISSDTLQASLGRLNKNIKPALFKQLGIEIATTDTGATDVQGTFLNVIDRLNGMKDPAEKAAMATKLLGRNWQEISEIIGMGSTGLAGRLAGVSGAKVMSDDDIKKAREFRDSMDNLKDVLENLVITLGSQVAPKLAALAETLAKVAGPMGKLSDASDFLGGGLNTITTGVDNISNAWDRFFTDEPAAPMASIAAASRQAGEYMEFLRGRVADTAKVMDDDAAATGRAYDATRKLRQATKDLNDLTMQAQGVRLDAVTQSLNLATAQADYTAKLKEGKTATEDLAVEANDLATKTADLQATQMLANGHTQTAAERTLTLMQKYNELQATLKKGSPLWNAIEAYKQALLTIPSNINTKVTVNGKVVQDNTSGKQGANSGIVGMAAGGTRSARSGTYLVGETGPELVTMGGGERVYSNPDTQRMMAGAVVGQGGGNVYNVTMAVRTMPTQRELTNALAELARRQGNVIP